MFDDITKSLNFDEKEVNSIISNISELRDKLKSAIEETLKHFEGIEEHDSIEEITPYHHGILTNFYEMEDMFVRLVDWSVDDEGVPESQNQFIVRITTD